MLGRHVAGFFATFWLLAVPAGAWQQELPQELKLLLGIKRKMSRNLALMPNYTCLETISRATRDPTSLVISRDGKPNRFRRTDVFRLEIAEIRGDELFARPGEHDFRKRGLRDLVPTGMMGTGVFSILAHSIFQTNAAVVHFAGAETLGGRTLDRFDFEVSELVSNYSIQTSGAAAIVGYHGSFWADPESLNPVRVDYAADLIPSRIGIYASETRIDYAITRIGSSDVLLPQSAEMTMSQYSGWANRNQISFTHCKEYGVSSAISFEELTGDATSTGIKDVEIPAGLRVAIRLETPIDTAHVRVGDLITGRVDADVRLKSDVAIPRNALVYGRIRHVEQGRNLSIGLEFTRIEFDGKRVRFIAEMEKLIMHSGGREMRKQPSADLPGVGTILAMGTQNSTITELVMLWRTELYSSTNP